MPQHKKPSARLTRIVRDARDTSKDYFIPAKRADELFVAGRLTLRGEEGGFVYATLRGEELR